MVTNQNQLHVILFVVFGIPGAGKTTIAKQVVKKLSSSNTGTSVDNNDNKTASFATTLLKNYVLLDLDLDDCVPEWMRLNFAQGIYPTLQQRNEFAVSCCNYVNESIRAVKESSNPEGTSTKPILVIVSFSFVNDDLRTNFRNEFPDSHWILINTSETEAQRRIEQRSNHFYKGKISNHDADCHESVGTRTGRDNNEWNFATVKFLHTIINGHQPIEETSSEIVAVIHTTIRKSSTMNGD